MNLQKEVSKIVKKRRQYNLLSILLVILLISFSFSKIIAQNNNSGSSSEFSPEFNSDFKPELKLNNKPEPSDNPGLRVWNLNDVDILALIGEMSRVTGKNFVIDSRVSGKATLVSNEPMTDAQAYDAFISILQVLGYSTIEAGAVTKIVPDSAAKQYDTKVNAKDLRQLGDEMVVQVIPVNHVSAVALIPVLRNLVNQQAHIVPYAPSNVIVIADHASNVARIQEIVHRIDKESSDDIEIIPLQDASADEMVKVLTNLVSRSQSFGESTMNQIKLAADLRTNSVLLGGDKSKRMKMRALIAQMDVPTPRTGNTEVIWLEFQKAEDLVPIISGVVDAYYGRTNSSSSGYDSNMRAGRSSSGASSNAGSYGSSSDSFSSGSDPFKSAVDLGDTKRGEGSLSGPGVRAEPNTNSLVVTAPPELMRNIKAVIARLDIRRLQILVEALIVEVAMDHTKDLGIEWRLPHSSNGFAGGTNFDSPFSTNNTGIINGVLGSTSTAPLMQSLPLTGMTVGFLRGTDVRAVAYALARDKNTNIISTPTLVSMDNSEAEIVVAERVPFQTENKTDSTGLAINNSVKYDRVGLILRITPMITKGDTVNLAIEQVQGSVKTPGVTPTTTERSIKTSVLVDSKDILVLGGLIESQRDAGESKIPILGDIPILGNFFKREIDTISKKNLMIFIRPVVMRTQEDGTNVTLSKYDKVRDSQLLHKVDPYSMTTRDLMPELPDLNSRLKQGEQELNIPGPFDSPTILGNIGDVIDRYRN